MKFSEIYYVYEQTDKQHLMFIILKIFRANKTQLFTKILFNMEEVSKILFNMEEVSKILFNMEEVLSYIINDWNKLPYKELIKKRSQTT